jgi:hypothetical protein
LTAFAASARLKITVSAVQIRPWALEDWARRVPGMARCLVQPWAAGWDLALLILVARQVEPVEGLPLDRGGADVDHVPVVLL